MNSPIARHRTVRVARPGRSVATVGGSLFLLPGSAQASPRTSANCTIATDTADAGGRRATSAASTLEGSAGGIVGISTVAAPVETARHGYFGPPCDVTGLTLTAHS